MQVALALACSIVGSALAGLHLYGHGGGGYGHGGGHYVKTVPGPSYLVKTIHHVHKLHGGGHILGHAGYGGHGGGHGGGIFFLKGGHGGGHYRR
ncbi:secreted protein, putative [Ixodes scapularis]|uniref:Secreted protein, putative n=1 Tax=Ixodes scapularis TaxID=6945 RepID=B7Q1N2_IXOSC|nr:secreted protein, putative [Ixodes scapularis]|eukprot:XP_002409846.1 secreted protein, putative [Ixodes scapularis]